MTIGKAELGARHMMDRAIAIDGIGRDQRVLELAAVGPRVGAETAADRARNAGQEFEPGDPRLHRRQRDVEVERAGSGADPVIFGRDFGKAAAEANGDARDAAVAHQQVRADADHGYRDIPRRRREKLR